MRPSFIAAALVTFASSAVATLSPACPFPYILVPKKDQCVCDLLGKRAPLKEGCEGVIKRTLLGIKYCDSQCKPSHPQPSGHYSKAKRNQPVIGPDGMVERCPSGMTVCPIDPPPALKGERSTATVSPNEPYECIQPSEDLYNCGGCTSTGHGVSCMGRPGVHGTSCDTGKCIRAKRDTLCLSATRENKNASESLHAVSNTAPPGSHLKILSILLRIYSVMGYLTL
ncbi:putative effector protein [Ceratobasidium theobromae]|uniref:Putative effector protein n=1 Tax=Ceratobasidium theobromae TaxID=1582974 RepID=A0A5N5QCI1_9AGAM|nr:putative effector protein [Ceratobasidium theobromae]